MNSPDEEERTIIFAGEEREGCNPAPWILGYIFLTLLGVLSLLLFHRS